MRFYFIRITWIIFILLGFYLIMDNQNDGFQKVLYVIWIIIGMFYYFLSKDTKTHFWLSILVAAATLATILFYLNFKSTPI
jgi:lipopolysaccharide export LptBFGC system permease protein LptF